MHDCGEHPAHSEPILAPHSDTEIAAAAAMFKALSEVPRLRILEALAQRPLCVTELAALSGDEISTVSQRLRILRTDRLVKTVRQGKHVVYSLSDHHVLELVRNALEHSRERH